jgi:hypothetical protein
MIGRGRRVIFGAIILQDGVANSNAFIANVGSGIITGRRDEFGDGILRLVAKGTA